MARVCEVCGKGPMSGHNVSHSERKTNRTWKPNLQKIRIREGKTARRALVCTSCLKANKVAKA